VHAHVTYTQVGLNIGENKLDIHAELLPVKATDTVLSYASQQE